MTERTKLSAFVLSVILAISAVGFALPSAAAHTCKAYDGCDAGACKDGENHDHTDYNHFTKDEHCSSTEKKPDPPKGSCEYFGVTWPKVVCDIIEKSGALEVHELNARLF